ncbi:LysE family translocator [Dickeya oryzae]|uniref:LysE family translocator n=1 Tax=Dickeya oryzae TaxID=1240404 RepID=A0AB39IYA7_9GAMM|nr:MULTISPECIES: LysE family translocator [Dickeya]AJC65880.1 threonine transporter RhtB [Dickeya zeae EC1]MBP2858792.1 LysE family translocator [Dickeya oryzae]MCA6992139.1 LysE family translocator [Dickeya oryzae]
MEQTSLIAFAFAALLLNLSPGPSLFFVSARGISEGKAAGAVSALGLASGSSIHALLAGLGVTAIVAKSVFVANAVALVGGVYILYLGYESLKAARDVGDTKVAESDTIKKNSLLKLYLQAVSVEFLNPKTILFYLSILPGLILTGGYTPVQALLVSLIVPATALPIDMTAGLTGGVLARASQKNRALNVTLNYVSGAALVFIGVILLYKNFMVG